MFSDTNGWILFIRSSLAGGVRLARGGCSAPESLRGPLPAHQGTGRPSRQTQRASQRREFKTKPTLEQTIRYDLNIFNYG